MKLFLHECIHFVLCVLAFLSTLYFFPDAGFGTMQLVYIAAAAFITGFFLDADHVIDYLIAFGWSFNIGDFFKGKQFGKNNKIYVLFHGYEYAIVLLLLAWLVQDQFIKALLLASALGNMSHLILDAASNPVILIGYSIIFRYINSFSKVKLDKEKNR